jgi:hypothetical protein
LSAELSTDSSCIICAAVIDQYDLIVVAAVFQERHSLRDYPLYGGRFIVAENDDRPLHYFM